MKTQRHKKILEIIQKDIIETQEELAAELKRQGYQVTQATVSRDIKELRLIKAASGDDRYRYALPGEGMFGGVTRQIHRVFRDSVTRIDFSENIIVVRTTPGAAQSVALAVDSEGFDEVIGTVAGDDTIMVIVKPKSAVPSVIGTFTSYLK
ncbi:arginine repressor [Phosphitispora sp. TUW77]|uniref:arginine repressor n=1 Tax=Phosphitispora sp. TUW77 TaxID=3152361 RepID=UPI003AB3DB91